MRRIRWWHLLVGIAVLNVLWSLIGVVSGEIISVGPATLWIVFGCSFILLIPRFYYALYREIQGDRVSDPARNSDPRLWLGGGALVSLLGAVFSLNPLTHYVGALYLIQRWRHSTVSKSVTEPGQ